MKTRQYRAKAIKRCSSQNKRIALNNGILLGSFRLMNTWGAVKKVFTGGESEDI